VKYSNVFFQKYSIFLIYFFSFLFSLPFISKPLINPDIFWHLSAGKFIFENSKIPYTDFLSWTLKGKEWIDFEWLSQVIYYIIYFKFNFAGLYFLKIFLILLNLFIIGRIILLFKIKPINLIWLLPFTSASFLSSNDIRPENFSAILFSLTLYNLEKERFFQINFKKNILFIFIYALWSNIHGGFLYGLFIIILYGVGSLINENIEFIYGKTKEINFSESKKYLILFLLSFAATFINPYGYKIYMVIFDHFKYSSILQEYIGEWRAFDITFEYVWIFVILLFSSIILFLVDFIKKEEKNFIDSLLIISFSFFIIFHMRNTLYSTIVFIFILTKLIANKIDIKKSNIISLVILVSIFLYFNFFLKKYYKDFEFTKFDYKSDSLVYFLKENKKFLSELKMFNMWVWGGWLGWELYPDYKVFVDGRYIFHPYLENVVKARAYPQIWNKIEKEMDLGLVIMEPHKTRIPIKQKLFNGKEFIAQRPFYLFLLPKIKWAIVYFDSKIMVAVRRDKVDKKWLSENEYQYLRPNDIDNLKIPLDAGDLKISDLEREIKRHKIQVSDKF